MKLSIRTGVAVLALAFLLAACRREQPEGAVFRTVETPYLKTATRSLLTAPDIETKKTGITLAAYRGGTLVTCAHFTQGFEAMSLDLQPGNTHTIYALVNMGDRRGDIPVKESDLEMLTYTVPSYTEGTESLTERGLPMAGKLVWDGSSSVIPLERLLAKVTAHLSCDWEGAVITSAKVYNLNAKLKPFGTGAVSGPADLLSFQELQDGNGSSSLTAVFYVPENRQGTIGSISSSDEKSPDRNGTVDANRLKLTYLETTVTSTGGDYAGQISYHSYLGNNATTNFDIERNARYDWTVVYHGDRTQDYDWKRDGDIFRVVVTADRTTAYVGETVRLTATCFRSDHGTESTVDMTDAVMWTKLDGGSDGLSISTSTPKGRVTATEPGSASFRAVCSVNGLTAYGDSPVITFRELPPLTVTWADRPTYVGNRGSFSVSGLVENEVITSVTSSDGAIAVPAATSGNTVYVNVTGTGTAILTVTASSGQTGTIPLTPGAPRLKDTSTPVGHADYYGHPDGADINTNPNGHDGLLPAFAYFNGSGSTKFTIGTDASPTTTYTGLTFAPDLYESILKPVLSVNDANRFGYEAASSYNGANRIWVKSLSDYPSAGGVEIGTLTASPTAAGCGVLPLTEMIYSVDPFISITGVTTWPDFYDREMISRYVSCESVSRTLQCPSTNLVNAPSSAIGWDVLLDGRPNAVMKNRFRNNMNYLWFEYDEGDALPHIGGECEVQITVINPYSGESVGKTFLRFKVIVCGVIAGVASVNQTSTFKVSAAYIGPAVVKPPYSIFTTTYRDEEAVTVFNASGRPNWATVSFDGYPHILGQMIYSVTVSNGISVLNKAQVYRSLFPEITWTRDLVNTPYSDYYRIDRLQDIQEKILHSDYHFGWLIEDGSFEPLD